MLESHRIAAQSSREELCCDFGMLFDAVQGSGTAYSRSSESGVLMALCSEKIL
jgi:hypothetical protein